MQDPVTVFTREKLQALFPPSRTNDFFEALFGDPAEGAYDITLHLAGQPTDPKRLEFALHLEQRPGCCLACNLTYGLPEVFSRHPVIDIAGLAAEIAEAMGAELESWELGRTREVSRELHLIPFHVNLR